MEHSYRQRKIPNGCPQSGHSFRADCGKDGKLLGGTLGTGGASPNRSAGDGGGGARKGGGVEESLTSDDEESAAGSVKEGDGEVDDGETEVSDEDVACADERDRFGAES